MITVEIMGGLGNQLFQIFAVIAYSLTNKIPFYFEKKKPTRSDRPFYWENFMLSLKPYLREKYDTNLPIYREQSYHYTAIPQFTHINKPFKLVGYFQSYKYFQEKEQEIFRFIRLHEQKEKIKESSIKKYDFANSIALHFRIGDYKPIQQHHPVMEVTYYITAIQHIISTTKREDWKIIYFYEEQDKNDVINNIKLIQEKFKNVTFVPIHTEINDYEQVLMMSLCQHNIIANSSFSWWGAYFNTNYDKIVCYPEKWFGSAQGNKKMDDLFPESWVRIDTLLVNDKKILMNYSKKQVILVSTGVFQTYIKDCINQLLKLDFDIHVIIDSSFFNNLKEYSSSIKIIDTSSIHTNFDEKSKLDKHFRGGFWNNTSKRLFLVYEYMRSKNIENVIHIENDVLLYSDMKYNFEEKIYITMDSHNRCIPGIIYIPKYDLFTKLIENYDFTKNDMINLADFYKKNKDIVKTFPIIDDSIDKCIYNENFPDFNSIFDGAAIGQYLGGVDPRNIAGDTRGFVNETCEIKYDKYTFKWIKKGKYLFPHIKINDKLIPINNLHIHCKNLQNFRMENPVENKQIQLFIR